MVLERYYENRKKLLWAVRKAVLLCAPRCAGEGNTPVGKGGVDWKFAYYPCVRRYADFYKKGFERRGICQDGSSVLLGGVLGYDQKQIHEYALPVSCNPPYVPDCR